MEHEITFTEDELGELREIMAEQLDSIIVEERRTDNQEYRDQVQRRHSLIKRMLDKVTRTLQPMPGGV